MNNRERFAAIMNYESFDRVPVYFFGTWFETKQRWQQEGLPDIKITGSSAGPQLSEMDPDWETGMWNAHDLVQVGPLSRDTQVVLEETDKYRVVRTPLGAILKESKQGSSISNHIEEALKPNRKSWEHFKTFLESDDPKRYRNKWEGKAEVLKQRDCVTTFLAGSLFGWPRDWMGVEAISILSYDDPVLFEEIIDYISNYFISLYKPVLEKANFELAYFLKIVVLIQVRYFRRIPTANSTTSTIKK